MKDEGEEQTWEKKGDRRPPARKVPSEEKIISSQGRRNEFKTGSKESYEETDDLLGQSLKKKGYGREGAPREVEGVYAKEYQHNSLMHQVKRETAMRRDLTPVS